MLNGVGQDEIGLEVLVLVLVVAVGRLGAEVGADTPDRQVHLGQPPSGEIRLLAVDGDGPVQS